VSEDGSAFGYHAAMGALPMRLEHLRASGEELPESLFTAPPPPPREEMY